MAIEIIEIKEQCKQCFHFQVCASVLKQQLYIREKMLNEENPKCKHYKPTADVEEVVRCEDCVYFDNYRCEHERHEYQEFAVWAEPNDFCSYGERKEGD